MNVRATSSGDSAVRFTLPPQGERPIYSAGESSFLIPLVGAIIEPEKQVLGTVGLQRSESQSQEESGFEEGILAVETVTKFNLERQQGGPR
jgi:hypothetical protein